MFDGKGVPLSEELSPESKNVTAWAANNSCLRLKTLETGGQVFGCGLGGGLSGGVPLCLNKKNHRLLESLK